MLHGEATHVQLIDHHLVPGDVGTAIVAPSKGGIDHLALEHAARAVTPVERQILALVADGVAKQRIAPAQAADHVHCIRVEQQLVGIEAMAFVGSVWAVHAVAIEHAGPRFRQVTVPYLIGSFLDGDALQFAAPRDIEKA